MAVSLYRKYRPEVFSDVVGQEHVEHTLVNALRSGGVAHAYLFCGPRGTGKTTTARLLAKALLCESAAQSGEPDGSCEICTQIAAGVHPDVYELDAASRTGVDNVREEIISRVQFAPLHGRYKVYIIDEVHMLSTAAFNALLKTLEEPPEHVVFVLCTTDPQKVPATIQSRCQRFDFRRLSVEEIAGYLRRICDGEGFSAKDDALDYIANAAAGGMRDATTALEQVAVAANGQVTLEAAQSQLGRTSAAELFELAGCVAAGDAAASLLRLAALVDAGGDATQIAADMAGHARNLYVASLGGDAAGELLACSKDDARRYAEQAAVFGGPARLAHVLETCDELRRTTRSATDARLEVEVALVKMCRPQVDATDAALLARIEHLEQDGVAVAASAAAPASAAATAVPAVQQAAAPVEMPHQTQASTPRERIREEAAFDAAVVDVPFDEPTREQVSAQPAPSAEVATSAEPATGVQVAPAETPATLQAAPVKTSAASQSASVKTPATQQAAPTMSDARLTAAVLAAVKHADVATSTMLSGVVVSETAENAYSFTFPKGAEFAMKLASQPDASRLIERALRDVVGQNARLTMQMDASAAAGPQAATGPSFATVAHVAGTDGGVPTPFDEPAEPTPFDEAGISGAAGAFDPPDMTQVFDEDDAYAMFDAPGDFTTTSKPVDDATARDLGRALSAFGPGVKMSEIETYDEDGE